MKKILPSALAIGLLALASCSKAPQVTITAKAPNFMKLSTNW